MGEGKFIRVALVGLPIGLLVFGIGSMLYTQFKPYKPEYDADYQKRMDAASLNRRPVNRADLERFVRILSEEIGERNLAKPEELERTAIWIESTLKGGNMGYQVKRQVFPVNGTVARNLIAELPGTGRRKEIIVVGSHYDTAEGCPGANSGGSGVAAVLALARAFAGDAKGRTIRFVFFANGEDSSFQTTEMGSLVYAKSRFAEGENIVAMLGIDSIGYYSKEPGSQRYPAGMKHSFPDTGDFLAFVGDEASRFRADSARGAYSGFSDLPAISGEFPGLGSDPWAFSKVGYLAVLATDTAQFRDPHFQKPSDTFDKIDFENLEQACRGLKEVVEAWAAPGQ